MWDWEQIIEILNREDALGNSLLRWLIVVAGSLAGFMVLRLVRRLLVHNANRLAETRAGDWFRGVERVAGQTKSSFLLILAAFCGSTFLVKPERAEWEIVGGVMVVAALIQTALWADAFLLFLMARYVERHKDVDAASVTTLSALGFVGRLAIWTAAVLVAVSNLGINVSAMITGLGIGGVAVALAAQNILGDLFASASIVLDKPFVLGDFIVVGTETGTVEYIGLKTTRLRSLSGEQLVFSNTDLLKSRIHNYKRMAERRISFTVNVDYDTPHEKVARIPTIFREAVEAQSPIRFDRAHFARYGDSALVFEVVYYVLSANYGVYMDVQQAVNLEILRRFAEEKIDFAYPARTTYQRKPAATTTSANGTSSN
jgi:small-conductance mechanosensitive channel